MALVLLMAAMPFLVILVLGALKAAGFIGSPLDEDEIEKPRKKRAPKL